MRTTSLLLLLASMPFAGEIRPFVLANAGLTMPTTKIDDKYVPDDVEFEDVSGYSATIGLGVSMALNPQIDLFGSAGYSVIQGGLKYDYEDSYEGTYSSYEYSSSMETTLQPKLIDIEGGALFHATPKLSLGGALVYSIPVGGSYETETKFSYTSDDTSYTESDDDDGKIEDELDDEYDAKPKAFASLKLQGEYLIKDRLSLTFAWLIPMGDYISEDDNTVSWSRAVVGIKYAFSMPSSTSTGYAAPAAPAPVPAPAPTAPVTP